MVQTPPQRLACPRCKRAVEGRYDCPWDGSMAIPAETLDPKDPLQGEVVARRHQVLFQIGQGGMGTVYSAWDSEQSREVALKVIHWEAGRDPALIARFRREVAATQRLDHPNVVRLVDAGRTSSGWLYIAMERLYGRTLADFIRAEAPVPGPRAARLLVPVCQALEAAHALGLVHRDLKPANIFLTDTGGPEELVKLLDFGIARAIAQDPVDDAISGTTVVGTVSYLAPEQARREPIDGRADLYALGIILYELLTGQPPFDFEAPLDTIRAHVESPVRPPRALAPVNVSPALDALCLAMLAKRPEDRPATAREVRRLLLEAVREAEAPPPVVPASTKLRRRRRLLLGAAVTLLALLVYWLTV
jgi:serine/threonine-protein kinase